jgi:hypothetical protein
VKCKKKNKKKKISSAREKKKMSDTKRVGDDAIRGEHKVESECVACLLVFDGSQAAFEYFRFLTAVGNLRDFLCARCKASKRNRRAANNGTRAADDIKFAQADKKQLPSSSTIRVMSRDKLYALLNTHDGLYEAYAEYAGLRTHVTPSWARDHTCLKPPAETELESVATMEIESHADWTFSGKYVTSPPLLRLPFRGRRFLFDS